jgi:chorismate mutase/prephenate dehydratase
VSVPEIPRGDDSSDEKLRALREEIDGVDEALVELLSRRMRAVREVGSEKGGGARVIDPARELDVARRWQHLASEHGLPTAFVQRILTEVVDHARRAQEHVVSRAQTGYREWVRRVGFQGEADAYSDLALQKLLSVEASDGVERIGYESFTALLDSLEVGRIDAALVPVENSISGSVADVSMLLAERHVLVVDEETWHVQHCLAAPPGTRIEQVRTIHTHVVALQQCRRSLAALTQATAQVHWDTAGAASSVARLGNPTEAAVCSEAAARRSGLEILRRNLEDHPENVTRFLLVVNADDSRASATEVDVASAKTSLAVALRHERGALASCLQVFASHDINLTRIESRPQPGSPWVYLFLIDFEGHRSEPRVANALSEIAQHANHVRVLGSYRNRTHRPVARLSSSMGNAAAASHETVARGHADGGLTQGTAALRPASTGESKLLVHRRSGRERSLVPVRDVTFGGDRFVLIAGPCSVESREQILASADLVRRAGARLLRGGAFKPRSSPYSFQGLGWEGVDLLAAAGASQELPVVTEVLRTQDLARLAEKADMLQVGARNMQNFELLKALGRIDRPVLLKRGMSATLEELLQAAEYILAGGNQRVVLCERGIRTFEPSTRNTLDVAAIPVLRERTHLPVIVDPSHAAGRRDLVIPLALAAAAAGADGLIVEAHPKPEEALSDREQTLSARELNELRDRLIPILAAQGRTL